MKQRATSPFEIDDRDQPSSDGSPKAGEQYFTFDKEDPIKDLTQSALFDAKVEEINTQFKAYNLLNRPRK